MDKIYIKIQNIKVVNTIHYQKNYISFIPYKHPDLKNNDFCTKIK